MRHCFRSQGKGRPESASQQELQLLHSGPNGLGSVCNKSPVFEPDEQPGEGDHALEGAEEFVLAGGDAAEGF